MVETNIVWIDNVEPFKKSGVTMAMIAEEAGKHGIAMSGSMWTARTVGVSLFLARITH